MGAKPQLISLDSFVENCIPDMIADNVYFGIFYNSEREGVIVDGKNLKNAIEQEVRAVWE